MASQIVLNEKQSTYGGPYGFYTVTLTPSNRTSNSVTLKCDVSAHLQYGDSWTQMGVTCGLYVGGAWHNFVLVPYGMMWHGTTPTTTSTTITVTGLTESQTSITGIQFRAQDSTDPYGGPSLNATSCSNLSIDSFNGSGTTDVMVPQVMLSEKQSTYSGPYGFYTVTLTPSNRTTNSVVVKCDVAAHLQYAGSWTQMGVKCGLYIGGAWHDFILVPYGTTWEGTGMIYASTTITVTGLTASQTSITGIQFRALDLDPNGPGGPQLNATACPALAIISANGASTWTLSGSPVNVDGTLTASITPVVSTNYHTFKLSSGSNSTSFSSYSTSASLSIAAGVVGPWFGGSATSLSATLTMYTYDSGGIYLGESSKTVTIKMTSAAGAPANMSVTSGSVSKGSVTFTITPPATKYNASISSYSVSSNIGTASRSGTTITVSIPSGASSSTVTVSVTATDSRGYTTSASGSASYNGVSTFTFGATSVNLEQAISVAVDEWVAANTYSLSANGVTFANKTMNNNTTCNFAAANFGGLFGSTSTTASTTMTCSTFDSSGNQIGSSSTKTINLTMPEAVGAPTGMGLTITSTSSTQIVATMTPPTTKYGATISKYEVATNNGTASRSGNTITVTNSAGFGSGKVQISVYAVDSRGFKSNTAIVEKLNTVPKILLNGASYEKVMSHGKNVVAIYFGSTRTM